MNRDSILAYLISNVAPETSVDTGVGNDARLWILDVQNGRHADRIGVVYESGTGETFVGDPAEARERFSEYSTPTA